jgi:predicted dehydrogenase
VTRLAVVGTDHLHVVDLTRALVGAGAHVVAVVPTEDAIGPWLASQHPDAARLGSLDDALALTPDLVVTAAVPSERAAIGVAAMRAGADVVADKPGAVSRDQLGALRAAHSDTGRCYTVVFSERLGSPAMVAAERLVGAGRIGRVVHTVGLGPHTLALDRRPDWFSDPARYGGILVDIGSHQVDQFLAFTGSRGARVLASTVRTHPERPGVEVLGEMLLEGDDGVTGYARVDYLTPAGLGAWGDVRWTVVGTDGYLEVRHVEQTVTVVDGERRETVDCAGRPVGWAADVVAGRFVDQEHVFTVTQVCLDAQAAADGRPLPHPPSGQPRTP